MSAGPRRRSVPIVAILIVVALPLALAACNRTQAGGRKMLEILYFKYGESSPVVPEAVKLVPGDPASADIPEGKPEGSGYFRPFANHRLNSRSPYPLPRGDLKAGWRADSAPEVKPAFVLEQAGVIYVHGAEWRVFDLSGTELFRGITGGPAVVLDANERLVYRFVGGGEFAPTRLQDGKPLFLHLPTRGDTFSRNTVLRHGDRYLLGGNERQLSPYVEMPATDSLLEILDAPDPIETTALGTLTSGMVEGALEFRSPRVIFAANGGEITAAAPGFLFSIDWDLRIGRAIETGLDPELMSLDEAGRCYLYEWSEKRASLHLVTPDAKHIYACELPPGTPRVVVPPIVAYDHRVFLLAGDRIIAVGADGRVEWTRTAAGPIGGAVVTPDGLLLVAEGNSISTWDAKGDRKVVFSSPGERFLAPPVITAGGGLLAITSTALYCLKVADGEPDHGR